MHTAITPPGVVVSDRAAAKAGSKREGRPLAREWEAVVTWLILVVGALILLSVAVLVFGVDSRDGNDWADHRRM